MSAELPNLNLLFKQPFDEHREKTAVICGNTTLSYAQLDTLANHIANVLRHRHIGSGDLVGVCLDRSVDLVATLLAVWRSGAAYVPIDPALPAQRISQMLEDACPKLVIVGANPPEILGSQGGICLSLDQVLHAIIISGFDSDIDSIGVQSDDLAYVMYTSGSTGRPKGVEVCHGNVANLLLSMRSEPGCDVNDRLLAITTVSFDMAVLELFLPLLCGATVIIAQQRQVTDPDALVRLMLQNNITIMQGTPAIWQMLLDSGWRGQPRLRRILCGGEALSRSLADRLLPCGDVMWNMYGPTEVTVYASIWRVCRNEEVVIGGPIANARLYVLDPVTLAPVPSGRPGELCVGGSGVARGYRNNDELSRAKFVSNPFDPGLMYRTGDLAHFLEPGKLHLLGRMDGQVKIRGHRIELGEVEAAVTKHDEISGAVVVCRDDRLIAYCLIRTANPDKAASLDRWLRPWLAGRLPGYMVPAFFVALDAFPVTINGKIDRKALPNPTGSTEASVGAPILSCELEGQIRAIWVRTLGHDRVSATDNFFEIGGDSVRLIRLQKELENLVQRPVPAPTLFEYYTVRTQAEYLSGSSGTTGSGPKASQRLLDSGSQDIAIVSMACRLPGGVTTPEEFWNILEHGRDVITDVPKDRWDADAMYDPGADSQGKSYCRRGGFLDDVNSFDTSLFGISPREARRLDPAQYILLETCWEGFERAGYTLEELRGSRTGVFIGTSNILAYQGLNPVVGDNSDLDGYAVTGTAGGTMSGRISYQFGLQGPTMTIDTACSSSLVATHLACNALRHGECDMAVSGGISMLLNPGLHIEFSRLQGMSPDGRCRAFSADTQGTGWSEGSATVVLKRLSDALRDGDTVHAVIRGTAVNHDGRSASLTTPSGPAQQQLIQTALASAGLQPGDVDYIEAHGTGTRLGDPIEAAAIASVFGWSRAQADPLLIGSVKSNVGHTQAAAGLVGLLKVVLAMQHGTIPRSLHVSEPTPAVDWQGSNMRLALDNQRWVPQPSRPRCAGVSAFGIGGTNAHVIVQEPPGLVDAIDGVRVNPLPRALPFLISGDTDAALHMQVENLHERIRSCDDRLEDISFSLATTRTHLAKRLVLMAQDKAELLSKLNSNLNVDSIAETPRVSMLFTGQGSQWPGMGKDLAELYPAFGQSIRDIAATLDTELEVPLLDVMWADPSSPAAALLDRTDFAQPALFALEVSLWRLWRDWGVKPDFVLGHSLGELVAAHIAGVLDLPDACRLVAARGRLMQAQSGDYGMASLEASLTDVTTAIEKLGHGTDVDIAAHNTPTQTVVSGKKNTVDGLVAHFAGRGFKTKTLVVGHAFHSRFMDGMLEDFFAVAGTIRFRPPQLGIVSSVSGRLANAGELEEAGYWARQVRQPVRFRDGIQTLARRHGVKVFLELGPRQVLCGMGAACLADVRGNDAGRASWLPSLAQRKDSTQILQRSLAQLHVQHVPINWQAYFKPFGCRRVQLPTYAFQRTFNNARRREVRQASRTPVEKIQEYVQGSFHFEVAWHPVNQKGTSSSGSWGVVCPIGTSTWTTNVVSSLSQTGVKLAEVDKIENATDFCGLICLWDSDNTDIISQTGIWTEKALNQLQTAVKTQFAPALVWVTRHAVGTGSESDDQAMILGPGAALWGLLRTARNEHPELQLRLVDLARDTTDRCLRFTLVSSTEPECAVRHDRVLVPRMQRISKQLLPPQKLIRRDGAVLITGGLGYLGAHVARWLAIKHGIQDFVLTSRNGIEGRGAKELVDELSRLGARATVIAGNVADPDTINSIMATFGEGRPLRGVVHAAGMVDSGVLVAMTPARCETAMAPKVNGAWLLHQATLEMDLDLFVMFSSISGVMGMPGLANYAAANTFLDAMAHWRRAQGLAATSVAFGTIAGNGGMAARLGPATNAHLAHFGLDPLPPDSALELLGDAVFSSAPLSVGAALDLERLRAFYQEQSAGIPSLLGALLGSDNRPAHDSLAGRRSLREILREAEPGQHADIVLSMVRQVVAKTLGFTHPQDVEVDRSLKDIGIDSLTAVQTRNRLALLTGLKLSVNITFLHPTLRTLSQSLLSQLGDTASPSKSSQPNARIDMTAARKGCLDSNLKFTPSANAAGYPNAVFLTGATGFVGASILYELLKRGIPTYCLVRADSSSHCRQRIGETLQEYGLWEEANFSSLIVPVVGDLGERFLGLDEQAFSDLADHVDAICHAGGLVDWMRPLEDYIGPNVVSTHEVLRLAASGRAKAVHVVSTISTLSKHMGLDLGVADIEYGYGTSKYMAERLVAAARWRGAKAFVYRLPYVTASTATGHFRQDRGDFLHNLIVGSMELGAFPLLEADMSAVLPVDYLAKTIVSVITDDASPRGCDWDFLNRNAGACTDFFRLVSDANGGEPTDFIEFGAWKQKALDFAAAHPSSALARIAAVLDSYTDETAAAMFGGSTIGENVFGDDIKPAPMLDKRFVEQYWSRIRGDES